MHEIAAFTYTEQSVRTETNIPAPTAAAIATAAKTKAIPLPAVQACEESTEPARVFLPLSSTSTESLNTPEITPSPGPAVTRYNQSFERGELGSACQHLADRRPGLVLPVKYKVCLAWRYTFKYTRQGSGKIVKGWAEHKMLRAWLRRGRWASCPTYKHSVAARAQGDIERLCEGIGRL